MLQSIHEHLKGWIAAVIIFAISASFVLWGAQYYLSSGKGKQATVAKVNGEKITLGELNRTYRQLQRQALASGLNMSQDNKGQLKNMALQTLITQTLLWTHAEQLGLRIGQAEVSQVVAMMPQFQVNGRFSNAKFLQSLYANELTPKQFMQQLHQELVANQLISGIQRTSFVLPQEVARYYSLLNQQRSFSYALIPASRFVADVTVSDSMVKTYYQQHQDQFRTPEKVSLSYVLLSPADIMQKIKITEQQLKDYYAQNKSNYKIPTSWKIDRLFLAVAANATSQQRQAAKQQMQSIATKLKQGVSFEQLMRQQRGITQTVSANQISVQFVDQLNRLKPRQVSPVFVTDKGVNLVRLQAVYPEKIRSYAQVQRQIKNQLQQEKAQSIISKKNDMLTDAVYTNPDSLQPAAKLLATTVKQTALFSRQGLDKGVAADKQVLAAAFSEDVLQGNNSNPIVLSDGRVIVVRLNQYLPSQLQSLAAVKDNIVKTLKIKLAEAKAALYGDQVVQALNKNSNVSTVTKKYALNWQVVNKATRQSKKINQAILAAAFKLHGSHYPVVTAVPLANSTVAILRLTAVHLPSGQTLTAKISAKLQKDLQFYQGRVEYGLYMQSLAKDASIKKYPEVMHSDTAAN